LDSLWYPAALIFILILANGFFSCSEIAIITTRKSRVKELADHGNKRAKVLQKLQNEPDRFLATIQIGVTVVGSLAAAVGGVAAVQVVKPWLELIDIPFFHRFGEAIALGSVVLTISYLTLVLGELVPKSLGLHYPERIALLVSGAIERLSQFSSILIRGLTLSSRLILGLFGARSPGLGTFVSEDEIKALLREGREHGVFNQTEQELIHSVFEFTDISVKEVIVPRPKMCAISVSMPVDEALRIMAENQFSRYPVYRDGIGDIIGILFYKDLIERLTLKKPIVLSELVHPAYFVPETMKVSHLLKELQKRRTQMAIVINEYGSVEGLVTMEDLLEEIVGEIRDEYDHEEGPIERLKDGALVIDASLTIRDLKEDHGLAIPESPEYETLGGFLLANIQSLPRGGENIIFGDHKFTVVDMQGRRIAKIKVEKISSVKEKVKT
jgi:putative hemolysin